MHAMNGLDDSTYVHSINVAATASIPGAWVNIEGSELDVLTLCGLLHHVRYSGKGYPFGFAKDQIDSYSSIIAIADVYDALTSDRCYRSALCPFDMIAIFEYDDLNEYNPTYICITMYNIVLLIVSETLRSSHFFLLQLYHKTLQTLQYSTCEAAALLSYNCKN